MPCVKVNGPFGVREGASPGICGYLGAMVGARARTVPGSLAGQSVVLQVTLTREVKLPTVPHTTHGDRE